MIWTTLRRLNPFLSKLNTPQIIIYDKATPTNTQIQSHTYSQTFPYLQYSFTI